MRLSNFKLEETKGTSPISWEYFASVDVETGFLFWKKKERRKIRREYAGYWHFVDTGEYAPAFQAEALSRAWTAQTGQAT